MLSTVLMPLPSHMATATTTTVSTAIPTGRGGARPVVSGGAEDVCIEVEREGGLISLELDVRQGE